MVESPERAFAAVTASGLRSETPQDGPNAGKTLYKPVISYVYEIDGVRHESPLTPVENQLPPEGVWTQRSAEKKAFPRGTKIAVYVDPGNPSLSSLAQPVSPRRPIGLWAAGGICLLLVLFGVFVLFPKLPGRVRDGENPFQVPPRNAGSDAGGVSTRAVHDKEKKTYTLNGTKAFITNGGIADIYLIFANTRKDGGIRGLTAFIVPKGTPGFKVGRKEDKMGIRPSNTCELILDNVVIPESNRVGREGQGFRIAMQTLDSARPFVGAVSVGLAQAALDVAVAYAKERKQFGQPIASFEMVQEMVADMAMAL